MKKTEQQIEHVLQEYAEMNHGIFTRTYPGNNPAQKIINLLDDLAGQHNNLCNMLKRKDLMLNGNMPTLREVSSNFVKLQVIADSNKSDGVLSKIDDKLDDLLIRETAYIQVIDELNELKTDLNGYHRVYTEMDGHLELYRDVVQEKLPEAEKRLSYLEKITMSQEERIKEQGKQIKKLEALLVAKRPASKSRKNKVTAV